MAILQTRTFHSLQSSNGYTLGLTVNENAINTSTNKSDGTYNLFLKATNANFSQFRVGWSISLDGRVVSSKAKGDAPQISVGKNSSVNIASGSFNIVHDDNGEKSIAIAFSIDMNKTSYTPGAMSVSGQNMKLTFIPRATIPTVPDITMGSAVKIKLPRASNAFTHSLSYTFGTASGSIGNDFKDEAVWNVPESLASQIPDNPSGKGKITCQTYNGKTLIGTQPVSFTATISPSTKPKINVVDISEAVVGISEHFNAYVQRRSRLKIKTSATGVYGSSVSSVQITVDGKAYTGAEITTDILLNSGNNVTVNVKVTDSRKQSAEKNIAITVLEYSPPAVKVFSGKRSDKNGAEKDTGEYMGYSFDYRISPLNNLNTALFQVQYKKADGKDGWHILTSGTEYSKIVNDVSTTEILDSDYPYNIRLLVKDFFETVYVNASDIPTAFTLIDYDDSGRGISFGAVADGEGFHVHMPFDFYGLPLSDFVCEIGTSGIWTYRKYASGAAECWGKVTLKTKYSNGWGQLFVSDKITPNIDYPFAFIERPQEFGRGFNSNCNCWVYTEGTNTDTKCAGYHGIRATQVNTETEFTVDIFVIGKWK